MTGGASAPDALIGAMLDRLAAPGYTVVEEVMSRVESQTFARPRRLDATRSDRD